MPVEPGLTELLRENDRAVAITAALEAAGFTKVKHLDQFGGGESTYTRAGVLLAALGEIEENADFATDRPNQASV
jgi:hypothetical protein